jgi:hypothetical protein
MYRKYLLGAREPYLATRVENSDFVYDLENDIEGQSYSGSYIIFILLLAYCNYWSQTWWLLAK